MRLWLRFQCWLLSLIFLHVQCSVLESEPPVKLKGKVCAYGDMDRDLNTDLIMHDEGFLKIYNQDENGAFSESSERIEVGQKEVSCVVGDFNGDAIPDILVSVKTVNKKFLGFVNDVPTYDSTVYLHIAGEYKAHSFNVTFGDELSVMDVNGDGTSDVIGFLQNETFFCRAGRSNGTFDPCEDDFIDFKAKAFKGFLPAFVDITGDLSAEIIFGVQDGGDENRLRLDAWTRDGDNDKWHYDPSLIVPLDVEAKAYGAALIADFDGDGSIDIGIPICSEKDCTKLEMIKMWSRRVWQSFTITAFEGSKLVSTGPPSNVIFRVGDFSLDGYPDLIALVMDDKSSRNPMIFENVPSSDWYSNMSRKFELRTNPRLIQPSDVALGEIQMASFFDLKEDGTLDVLLEYLTAGSSPEVDFIRCEDKGDTTFLKIQVFSSSCAQNCGSEKIKIGSGIAWHGACVMFNMSDSWGHEQRATQCQMPQTAHRALHTPFALFGLGRSPNFVDFVHIGSPRVTTAGGRVHYGNQHHDLKQIVPNSRVIVVPPKGDGTHWQSRLYLTPSQLIVQSLLVLVVVCGILLLLVALLHFRERRADQQERQAQSHRFHFDAM